MVHYLAITASQVTTHLVARHGTLGQKSGLTLAESSSWGRTELQGVGWAVVLSGA